MDVDVSEWKSDAAGGRVFWDHISADVPRVWLQRDGSFFFNLPDDENGRCPGQSYHDTFKGAAEAALLAAT